jgi:predicted lipoprotein with Yx(FWY)xxD motif
MKRPAILIPLAVVAVIAVVAVAIAGKSDNNSSTGTRSAAAANPYGSAPAPAAPAAAAGGARVATADHGLGTMLVDAQGRTLYLWKADMGSASTCSGACAQDWPPVTTSGAAHAGQGARAALLGTTKRLDGTTQVTYAGHPLYRFAGDSAPGQVNGQGSTAFGAAWLVVAPGGAAITGPAG